LPGARFYQVEKRFYKGLFSLEHSETERVNREAQVLTSLMLQFGVTAVAFIAFFASLSFTIRLSVNKPLQELKFSTHMPAL